MADGKYHIGFALSGGFIRGIAHLGMLQALFEHNIRPDILSGTSADYCKRIHSRWQTAV